MDIDELTADADFQAMGKLIMHADCAITPALLGHGRDSHGKRIKSLDDSIVQALEDVVTAGKLAQTVLDKIPVQKA